MKSTDTQTFNKHAEFNTHKIQNNLFPVKFIFYMENSNFMGDTKKLQRANTYLCLYIL